jgi:hypothetical protein
MDAAAEEPMVRRLSAGEEWIRTSGSAMRSHRQQRATERRDGVEPAGKRHVHRWQESVIGRRELGEVIALGDDDVRPPVSVEVDPAPWRSIPRVSRDRGNIDGPRPIGWTPIAQAGVPGVAA